MQIESWNSAHTGAEDGLYIHIGPVITTSCPQAHPGSCAACCLQEYFLCSNSLNPSLQCGTCSITTPLNVSHTDFKGHLGCQILAELFSGLCLSIMGASGTCHFVTSKGALVRDFGTLFLLADSNNFLTGQSLVNTSVNLFGYDFTMKRWHMCHPAHLPPSSFCKE